MKSRQSLRTSTRAGYLAITLVVAGISPSASALTSTWTGTTNGTWDTTTAANWGGTPFTSGDDALFTGTPANNVTSATGLTIGAITLDSSFTGSVSMTGNNTVSGAVTISGGSLSFKTTTGLGTSAVTVNSAGTLGVNANTSGDITYANSVAGAGKVQFLYNATGADISLNNLGSFTGTIQLSLASGSVSTGGKARLYGATLSGTSSLIIDSGTQLYMGGGNVTLANIQVSGTGNTENRGAIRAQSGTLTGAISLIGNTTIGTEGGTIAGSISSGASGAQTLTLGTSNSTGNLILSSNIGGGTGTIALNKTQGGTTTLSGTSSYSGGTTITGGSLSAGSNSALGTGSVAFNGGTLANSTNVTLSNNLSTTSNVANLNASGGTMVLNGNITGANGVSLTPTNKITLGGINSFATSTGFGNLNVSAGAGGVDITGSTTVGSGNSADSGGYLNVAGNVTVTVQSGGSLSILGTTHATKPGSIVGQNAAGTSNLVVNGGSLTIGGNTAFALGNNVNTATGVLTVSSGTATITAGSATLQNALNFVALGRDNATGIINLDGGTLATGRQFVRDGSSGNTIGSGTATFNFNGGTLQAQANQTSGNGWFETATSGHFQVVTTTVKVGGAKIDTNGFNTNINTVLAHDSGLGATADGGLTKSGAGTLSLGGANTYTGATSILSGKLVVNGSTATSSAVTVAAGTLTAAPVATLGGTGTIGGSVALSAESSAGFKNGGVLAPTASASGTALKVTGTTTFSTGSIFEWDLNAVSTDPGNGTTNTGNYGQLAGTGAITGSDSVFQIVLGSNNFSDAFWNTDKTWTNIFTGSGATTDLATIFSRGFSGSGVDASGVVLNRGSFTFNGAGTLSWSAVPEPGSAMVSFLIVAGLLRRRR